MFIFYAFLGALCLGLAPLFGKAALNNVNPATAFALRMIIATTIFLAWCWFRGGLEDVLTLPLSFWGVITVEAILAALAGDLAYFYALKEGNINEVALVMSSTPLITIMLSHFLLDESVSFKQIIGALFITLGLILVTIHNKTN